MVPTKANRNERLWEARLTVLAVVFIIVLLLLALGKVYIQGQNLRSTQENLGVALAFQATQLARQKRLAVAACGLRFKGRADQNLHVKTPLRGELLYFAALATTGAGSDPNHKRRVVDLSFARRFKLWAEQVVSLPNPKCPGMTKKGKTKTTTRGSSVQKKSTTGGT